MQAAERLNPRDRRAGARPLTSSGRRTRDVRPSRAWTDTKYLLSGELRRPARPLLTVPGASGNAIVAHDSWRIAVSRKSLGEFLATVGSLGYQLQAGIHDLEAPLIEAAYAVHFWVSSCLSGSPG